MIKYNIPPVDLRAVCFVRAITCKVSEDEVFSVGYLVGSGAKSRGGRTVAAVHLYKHDRAFPRDQSAFFNQQTKRCTATTRLLYKRGRWRDVLFTLRPYHFSTLNHLKSSSQMSGRGKGGKVSRTL